MKIFDSFKTNFILLLFFTLILGVGYPLVIFCAGQVLFHKKANGSLFYYKNKEVLGSELIGQNFSSPRYFTPRPSAAGENGYDATQSSASNLGPTSEKLISTLQERLAAYRTSNALFDYPVPIDAITTSGSGLDPHISVPNAQIQAARVAQARGLAETVIHTLISQHTQHAFLGFLGDKRVNVLNLNLALDALTAAEPLTFLSEPISPSSLEVVP